MDIFEQLGELALGSRLKRLSDSMMRDGAKVYQHYGIDFEPKSFPLFYFLHQQDRPVAIMEIANALNYSHPAIIQMVKELEKKGLVKSLKDKNDGRKRLVELTEKSKELLPRLEALWKDIANAIHQALTENEYNLINAIYGLEQSLNHQSLFTRIIKQSQLRNQNMVEIVDYHPDLGNDFKEINYEWINNYFKVEEADMQALENHESYILKPGGIIIFALYNGQVAGTCALIKYRSKFYEMSKMGVRSDFRGKGIGKALGLAIIERAKNLGAEMLFLDTNKKLTPAIKLYETLGFKHVNKRKAKSIYERGDVYMELDLKPEKIVVES